MSKKDKDLKVKKKKASKAKKIKPPSNRKALSKYKPPNPPFQKGILMAEGQLMFRGTVITSSPPENPDFTLRYADIEIPVLLDNPSVTANLYSTYESPAFALNNYGVTYNENGTTSIGVLFSNTRTDADNNPLPEPESNQFNCDYIIIGIVRIY